MDEKYISLHGYIRNTPLDTEVHGRQEYLTSGKEYIEPCKLINSSPHPGISLQSLNSSSQLLCLPGDQRSSPGDQSLSLWSHSTDSKTLDYQGTNPREYQIVITHTKETT